MYKIIIFAGTVEGRKVAEYLNRNRIHARVCVATAYGESLLPEGEYLETSHQGLSQDEMEEIMGAMEDGLVIDATHPYAQVVTENIQAACHNTKTEYIRVVRQEIFCGETEDFPVVYVKDTREAVDYLEHTKGNILVTTGSKELAAYTNLSNYKDRVYARVLSILSVMESCTRLGVEGKHLICMQGPFSQEMNEAMLRQVQASWMVTKESGTSGGFLEKYLAAKKTGCGLVVIGRPRDEEGISLEECEKMLEERFHLAQELSEKKSEEEKDEKRVISLVGIGMGTLDTLTLEGKQALEVGELLIGAGRMLERIKKPGQKTYIAYRPEEICQYIKEHPKYKKIAIALSGDVGFYSGAKKLLRVLEKEMPKAQRRVYAGISSMIYFCGRLETCWEDVLPVSLHGRERNLVGLLRQHPRIFAIVGNSTGVAQVCRKLTFYGMGEVKVFVGERLSYEDEKISRGRAKDFQETETDPLSVILLEREEEIEYVVTPGIPDGEFLRDKVPMTKEEIRSISLAKLRLKKNSLIYDVGAGTGSVSVEMALQAVDGKVYGIEKKEEAVALLHKNREKFRVDNLEIISGSAPEAMADLPVPTHAFIGGSSGNLKKILKLLLEKNSHIRVVINCITLETVAEAMDCIKTLPVEDVDIAQVNVAKGEKAGPYHLMMGQNPVYVISFQGREEDV